MNDRIKIIDSYMGSGKTSWAIQQIQELPNDTKIIYITPFLDEVERILSACSDKNFIQPERIDDNSKMEHLISLVSEGQNIVSTHALFSSISDKLIRALVANNYILFLDEVFQTIEKFDIATGKYKSKKTKGDETTKKDMLKLIEKEFIKIEEDYTVSWIDEDILSKYSQLKALADRGLLYFVNNKLLLWSFPIEVFREGVFQKIYILTHRFESQLQAAYYKYFELEYLTYHMVQKNGKYDIEITTNNSHEYDWIESIKNKIKIIDNPKLNRIGDVYYDVKNRAIKSALSKRWYWENDELVPIVKDNLSNFFKNITKSKSEERLWTSFKSDQDVIKSKNVSINSWLPINARSTNAWRETAYIAYLINKYLDPFYEHFFQKRNIIINQDEFALSEMLQFIWRSRIRDGKDITLYVPSARMRGLLLKYLNHEPIEF